MLIHISVLGMFVRLSVRLRNSKPSPGPKNEDDAFKHGKNIENSCTQVGNA